MPKRVAIIISPNWKDYAKKYLKECIESIRAQDYEGETRVFITDNETSPESVILLNKLAPEAELILNKENDGFSKGNNDSMRLALQQGFDYLFLINMDAVAESNCVSEFVKAAEADEKIGALQARLMLYDEKDRINSLGNITHFLGFGYCLGYKEKIEGRKYITENILYPSGAAVLFTRAALEIVGLYDEEFWMYNEDQDHGHRIWLKGFKCVLAPDAVVYHKYEFAKSIKQYYWMDRNRIIVLLKTFKILTLVLIMPAFMIMELGLVLFSVKGGWFKEKMRVWRYFLKPDTWIYLLRARREAQDGRKIKDREIAKMISGRVWYQEVDDWKLRFINPIFNLYWSIVKKMIIW